MNNIIIEDQKCSIEVDDAIGFEQIEGYILKLNIHVKKDTIISLKEQGEIKVDMTIRVDPHTHVIMKCQDESIKRKVQYHYFLSEGSSLTIERVSCSKESKSLEIVELNGYGASFNTAQRTIMMGKQRMDIVAYHNAKRTTSNIENRGVTLEDGSGYWNVTGMVYPGMTECVINQKNHIINLNNKTSRINPNLLIEENNVTANHSAYIGTFDEDIFFYLETRGIPRDKALSLLVEGFLTEGSMEEEIKERIKLILGGEK